MFLRDLFFVPYCLMYLLFIFKILLSTLDISYLLMISKGARCGAVGWGTAPQTGKSRVRFPMISLKFFSGRTLALGVDLASNRNKKQRYFLGGKDCRCVGLTTLPPSCVDCLEIGSLKLLEPSGSLQACNGTAFGA